MRYRSDLNIEIGESQRQLIVGTLLGDASCVLQRDGRNPYLRIGHSLKDIGYTEWKYNYLLSTNLLQSPIDKYGSFNTICHPKLWEFRTLFYLNGTKVITHEVLQALEPLGLAVWYMDDGSLIRSISRSPGPYYVMAMSCYTMQEVDMVCRWMGDRYGVEFRPYAQTKKGYNKVYPYMATTRVKDGRRFADLVGKYILEAMARKKY